MRLQSSEDEIHQGLDIWRATVIKHESEHWETDHTLEQQLGTTEFDRNFETTPYEEYDHAGHRVLSNLMSGSWAHHEAVWFSLRMHSIY